MTTTPNNNNNSYEYNYPPPSLPEGHYHSRQTTDSTQYSTSQAPLNTHPNKPLSNHTESENMPIRLLPDNNNHPNHHRSVLDESQAELTEDERIAYEDGLITWDKAKQWRFWFRKEWISYYVAFVLLVIVVALMAIFHHSIIDWLTPFTRKLQNIHYGWLIPVAILFVLSFPPLFGNEIVMILVGVVWGLGVGFAIVAVGISLGEVANYFVFKYWCSTRAERMTKKSLNYACLAQVVRDGGFWMAFMIRLSAVPTHFSTVLFAVCGLPFWQYCLALIAGLPKQLIAVYVGVVLAGSSGDTSTANSRVISDTVFGVTAVITLASLWYIHRKMVGVRKKVLIGMRKDLVSKGVGVSESPQVAVRGDGEIGQV